ncbi:hypothetical protein BS78_06G235200 [Paspalum vaginatum]|nr:hypothetical protein BS78_06G235200 [Paspalum vaginatum]
MDVMEKDGTTWIASRVLSHTFEEAGDSWGFGSLVKKSSSLKSMLRRNDDCLIIRCELTVLGEPQSEDVVGGAMASPEPNMHRQLGCLLEGGKGADVAFDVDGRLFRAHRCVLAALSPVFEAELFGPMKEKDVEMAEPIKVDDMEPSIFEELLHFMYTHSISSSSSDFDEDAGGVMPRLLVAADRYGLARLRFMCEVKLCRGIDAQTVADTLALAEQHHCARLKDACLRFIASRDANVLGVVMKTDGFKHLVASCPSVAVDILDKIAHG